TIFWPRTAPTTRSRPSARRRRRPRDRRRPRELRSRPVGQRGEPPHPAEPGPPRDRVLRGVACHARCGSPRGRAAAAHPPTGAELAPPRDRLPRLRSPRARGEPVRRPPRPLPVGGARGPGGGAPRLRGERPLQRGGRLPPP